MATGLRTRMRRAAAGMGLLLTGVSFAAVAADESSGAAPAVPPVAPSPAPVAAVDAAAEAAAALPGTAFSWSNYFEAVGILFVMLAVLWGVLWFVRRRGGAGAFGGGGAAGLRIESRVALGPKKWILTARCRDRYLILGVTEQQINLIADYPADYPAEEQAPDAPSARAENNPARPAFPVEAADFGAVLRRNAEEAIKRAED